MCLTAKSVNQLIRTSCLTKQRYLGSASRTRSRLRNSSWPERGVPVVRRSEEAMKSDEKRGELYDAMIFDNQIVE